MVPAVSDGGPRAPPYSGYPIPQLTLRLRDYHPLRCAFPGRLGSRAAAECSGPTTPRGPQPARFGLLPVRSPLLGESLLFSPPPATGMFRFTGFAPSRVPGLQPGGLPHSDTGGSQAMCASPPLFAACRVLHRLREPGHPPCALPYGFPRPRRPPSRAAPRAQGVPPSRPPPAGPFTHTTILACSMHSPPPGGSSRAGLGLGALRRALPLRLKEPGGPCRPRGECRIRTDGLLLAKQAL